MAIELDLDQDDALEYCNRLLQVLRLMRLYDIVHVNLEGPLQNLLELVNRVTGNASVARLEVEDGTVFLNRDPIRGGRKAFSTLRDLMQAMEQADLASLIFCDGLTLSSLRSFFTLLKAGPLSAVKEGLRAQNLDDRIQVCGIGENTSVQTEQTEIDDTFFPQAYGRTLVLVREYARTIHDGGLQRDLSQRLSRALRDLTCLVSKFEGKFIAMGCMKGVDEYIYTHMVNTGFLALVLGHRLGISRVRLSNLGHAAMLHALGKTSLPLPLRENTSHDEADLARLAEHPYLALESLLGTRQATTKNFATASVAFQFEAHRLEARMRLEPPHYPVAMIVRICAEYDALTTPLPDRPALTPSDALAQMLSAPPGAYDSTVLAIFGAMMGPIPVGSAVWLTTGHVAYVIALNPEHPMRPVVAMLKDRDGKALSGEHFDLTETTPEGKYLSSIKQVLEQWKLEPNVSEHLLAC